MISYCVLLITRSKVAPYILICFMFTCVLIVKLFILFGAIASYFMYLRVYFSCTRGNGSECRVDIWLPLSFYECRFTRHFRFCVEDIYDVFYTSHLNVIQLFKFIYYAFAL